MTTVLPIQTAKVSAEDLLPTLIIIPVDSNGSFELTVDNVDATLASVIKKTEKPFAKLAEEQGFKGKGGQLLHLTYGVEENVYSLLFVGIGSEKDEIRSSLVAAARSARKLKKRQVSLYVPKQELTRKLVEGFLFGAYHFNKYLTPDKKVEDPYKGIESLLLIGNICEKGLEAAKAYTKGVYKARDLGNEPPNTLFPASLADEAVKIAKEYGLKHTVYDEKYLTENGFNLLMAVGKGDQHQPRLIHLEYKPEGEIKQTIALVGKGITFDTGGYNLKTNGHILNMHLDMCGGAAVLGAAEIIGQLKPQGIAVHFIVPSALNAVSSHAYLPNDILTGLGGKTVEIQNTDAEGRLILADALTYAQQQKPDEIIDLATLTGACVVALGDLTAALYSTDESMAAAILEAAKEEDEDLWRMPLTKKLDKTLDSKVADMRNIGARMGGSITAALFLKRWVDIDNWAHIDLAGPAMAESDTDLSSAGGTGYGAALLARYIMSKS